MNRTLINPAVFCYTLFVKFQNWQNCIPLVLFMLLPSFCIITIMTFSHAQLTDSNCKEVVDIIKGYFGNTLICMLTSYFFVSDGFAGRKFISESDTMALLFTRPITRFCYVLSKFCGGLLGTTVIFLLGFSMALLVCAAYGIKLDSVHALDFVNLACNAATFNALMVFLHCAHPLVGGVTYFILMGAGNMGGMFTSFDRSTDVLAEIVKAICLFISEWFGDFVAQPVNITALVTANFLDTYELAVFFSNVVFYLLLAGFALSIREFSYGAE